MAEPPSSPPAFADDPWLTVGQVSDELKIHPATVRIWIKSGRLAAVRVGRTWRVRRSELQRALLADASPAFVQDGDSAAVRAPAAGVPTPAPMQIADQILTITPVIERR
jgi:excisionase family DNA binding protein